MRNRKRTNNNFQIWKNIKDYSIPLVVIIIILLLIINFIFSSGKKDSNKENKNGLSISLDSSDSEAYVQYPGDYKKKIEAGLSLYKGEKIIVKTGTLTIKEKNIGEYRLNKLGELKYNENGSFSLFSSDVWIKNKNPITIDMRFASLNIGENSVLNLTQNDVLSTIYLLDGFVEVSNLAGKNTVLTPGQKIMIARTDAAKEDIDIALQKEDIDDYFKASDWFIKNNGESYLVEVKNFSGTGKTLSGAINNKDMLIHFSDLEDEQTVSEENISINGTFDDEEIANITLGNIKAKIDKEEKTFSFSQVLLDKKVNDLIFKVYNQDEVVVGKYVYTIYSTVGEENTVNTSNEENNPFDVKNYSLDSTNFKFISPKQNPYTTNDDIVMIEGMVPSKTVARIEVNDFVLTKFVSNGAYWKYYANKDFGNLKEGLNVYEVKYYNTSGKMIYKNAFSIIKNAGVGSGETN